MAGEFAGDADVEGGEGDQRRRREGKRSIECPSRKTVQDLIRADRLPRAAIMRIIIHKRMVITDGRTCAKIGNIIKVFAVKPQPDDRDMFLLGDLHCSLLSLSNGVFVCACDASFLGPLTFLCCTGVCGEVHAGSALRHVSDPLVQRRRTHAAHQPHCGTAVPDYLATFVCHVWAGLRKQHVRMPGCVGERREREGGERERGGEGERQREGDGEGQGELGEDRDRERERGRREEREGQRETQGGKGGRKAQTGRKRDRKAR
jgi:hypothetical protein